MTGSGVSGKWVLGGLVAILGLIGLVMASRATDSNIYFVGLFLFVFTVLFDFALIGRYVGRHDTGHHDAR